MQAGDGVRQARGFACGLAFHDRELSKQNHDPHLLSISHDTRQSCDISRGLDQFGKNQNSNRKHRHHISKQHHSTTHPGILSK
jgi:hypothetical protein